MEDQKIRQLDKEIGNAAVEECLRIIIVKHQRLFSVLCIFLVINYMLIAGVGKGVEFLFTNERTSKIVDAIVNKTVSELTLNNFICMK